MAKKRANGEGTIRKRKNGTWEARITIGFDTDSGKQKYKSVYGKTQQEVKNKLAELQGRKNELEVKTEEQNLGEWLDTWIENFLADVKPGTVASYESISRIHLKPSLGDIELTKLKGQAIQKFYNELQKKELSPKYIKNIHGCLHRALDVAVKTDLIPKNPTSACVIPRAIQKEVTPLDIPEQQKLLAVLEEAFYGSLILVDIFTGLRSGELIGLTWDCVDFEHGLIKVEKQLVMPRTKGGEFKFGTLKNDKRRILAPAESIMNVLKKQKQEQDALKERLGDMWNPGEFTNLVFTEPDGSHLKQWNIWKEFQKILKQAGLPHYRVHDLRHTFAVNSILAGDDIKTIQENMGHYSSAFTLDRYGHVTETMRKNSSNRMQSFYEQITGES